MPWGEYKGRNFNQMPKAYLERLLTDDRCKEEWRREIEVVLNEWASQRKESDEPEPQSK